MINSYVVIVIAVLIFLLVLVVMFKKMTNREAERVIKALTAMSVIFPIAKITSAIVEYSKSKGRIDET